MDPKLFPKPPPRDPKPIPAFYCAYLLRSRVRPSKTYIGSTPNPPRRLKQHNGDTKGGAKKTSMGIGRPWNMACIVIGFPSSLATLQFEWAWDRTKQTLRVPAIIKTTFPTSKHKSLAGHLQALHVLLRVDSFSRWPLQVKFFDENAFELWGKIVRQQTIKERALKEQAAEEQAQVALKQLPQEIRKGISIELLDPNPVIESRTATTKKRAKSPSGEDDEESAPKKQKPIGGIYSLDITYAPLIPHLQKTTEILFPVRRESPTPDTAGDDIHCRVCSELLAPPHKTTVICPHSCCEHVAHVDCLAVLFLNQERASNEQTLGQAEKKAQRGHILPVSGTCPDCKRSTEWIDVVKELSYRNCHQGKTTKGMEAEDDDEGDDDAEIPEEEEEEGGTGSVESDSGNPDDTEHETEKQEQAGPQKKRKTKAAPKAASKPKTIRTRKRSIPPDGTVIEAHTPPTTKPKTTRKKKTSTPDIPDPEALPVTKPKRKSKKTVSVELCPDSTSVNPEPDTTIPTLQPKKPRAKPGPKPGSTRRTLTKSTASSVATAIEGGGNSTQSRGVLEVIADSEEEVEVLDLAGSP